MESNDTIRGCGCCAVKNNLFAVVDVGHGNFCVGQFNLIHFRFKRLVVRGEGVKVGRRKLSRVERVGERRSRKEDLSGADRKENRGGVVRRRGGARARARRRRGVWGKRIVNSHDTSFTRDVIRV